MNDQHSVKDLHPGTEVERLRKEIATLTADDKERIKWVKDQAALLRNALEEIEKLKAEIESLRNASKVEQGVCPYCDVILTPENKASNGLLCANCLLR